MKCDLHSLLNAVNQNHFLFWLPDAFFCWVPEALRRQTEILLRPSRLIEDNFPPFTAHELTIRSQGQQKRSSQ